MKILLKDIELIATFNENLDEIKNGWILIENNIIKNLGKMDNLADLKTDKIIDCKNMIIMPGFVNTHSHFYQSLFRALPEVQNAKLFDWLSFLYKKWENIDEESIKISSVVSTLELMKSGVTTTVDHLYLFPKNHPFILDSEIEGVLMTGIRFYIIRGSMCVSKESGGLPLKSVVQNIDEILKDYERVMQLYNKTNPYSMLRVALGPCSIFTVNTDLLRETLNFANRNNLLLHMHLCETKDEYEYCLSKYNLKPIDYMEEIGWLNNKVWFAHLVHINDDDIEKLSRAGIGFAHCPTANMRLGDGISPVFKMKNSSINIGLGVDGSASNDTNNFLHEIRHAMLLQRVKFGADSISPKEALYFGTVGGAKVLKLDHEIGSIEQGKAADIIGFKLNRLEFAGALTDPINSIVFCDSKNVDFSMINGKIIIENGNFINIDPEYFIDKQNQISKRLIQLN